MINEQDQIVDLHFPTPEISRSLETPHSNYDTQVWKKTLFSPRIISQTDQSIMLSVEAVRKTGFGMDSR